MAKGSSGRIVIEIDPDLKHRLHALLALRGITLKDWFVVKATAFVGGFGLEEITTDSDQISSKKGWTDGR